MNRQFRVKGISGVETYIELLEATPGGYEVQITSISESGIRESNEQISDELLDSCLRTGYLVEVKEPVNVQEREAALTA